MLLACPNQFIVVLDKWEIFGRHPLSRRTVGEVFPVPDQVRLIEVSAGSRHFSQRITGQLK
jgi:hypothetical protein